MMRPYSLLLLLSLCCLGATGARADWVYVPPPVDAVVTYDDGHTSRIDAISADRFTVINKTKGKKAERIVYRTWLLRERFLEGGRRADELFLDSAAANSIVRLWPLEPGESITHSFRTERKGKLQSTGTQVITYVGPEVLETPAGTFEVQRLERKYVLTKTSDHKQYRGTYTTWHDSTTGLILRVEWQTDDPDSVPQGSFVATAVELP
jgi:hypothetical protein